MKFKVYVVDVTMPRPARLALLLAIPLVTLATSAVLRADVKNAFASGDSLSAAKVNENFNSLDARLKTLEDRKVLSAGSSGYSVGATRFVKATSVMKNGNMGGYPGAKLACQSEVGTATAHLCTAEEVLRSASLGVGPTADGWMATGVYAAYDSTNTHYFDDCNGFTSNNASNVGMTWLPNGAGVPYDHFCSEEHPLLCCD